METGLFVFDLFLLALNGALVWLMFRPLVQAKGARAAVNVTAIAFVALAAGFTVFIMLFFAQQMWLFMAFPFMLLAYPILLVTLWVQKDRPRALGLLLIGVEMVAIAGLAVWNSNQVREFLFAPVVLWPLLTLPGYISCMAVGFEDEMRNWGWKTVGYCMVGLGSLTALFLLMMWMGLTLT